MTIISAGDTGSTLPEISNSLRFDGSNDYLTRTYTSSATNTFSVWVKRSKLGAIQPVLGSSIKFNAGDTLTAFTLTTTAVFRDPSAWLHIHVSNGGLYVNGVSYGAVTTSALTNASLGTDGTNFFDGYLAYPLLIDGSSSAYTNTAYTDPNGQWRTLASSSLKALADAGGTNSFFLDFSDGSSTTTLGNDASSKNNDWTLTNMVRSAGASDCWSFDTPTNNHATLNPLHTGRSTITNGALTASGATDLPTIVPDSGTWYFEISGVSKTWTPPAAFPATSGDYNFGQRSFNNTATNPTLSTKNLPTPSVIKPSEQFQVKLDTGANIKTTAEAVFPSNFLEIIKDRANANNWQWLNSVTGNTAVLQSNTTSAETTYTAPTGNSVATVLKAGGAAVTNNAGSITSQVSANTAAGFSIVTYTGTGANATVGHGLGVAPKMVIVKSRDSVGGVVGWIVGHSSLTGGFIRYLTLHTTNQELGATSIWNDTSPTSSVFSVGTDLGTNYSTKTYVAYCFAEVPGFSKIASYTGNGSADGPFVLCGFRPRFVMAKNASVGAAGYDWAMIDSTRNPYNPGSQLAELRANLSDAERTNGGTTIDLLANGFKVRSTDAELNGSGNTIIFIAFAEAPFKYSNAR